MSNPTVLIGGVILVLAGIGWGLLRLIGWLRRTNRYIYFELFVPLFMVLMGAMAVLAPREAAVPLWIFGITAILIGLWNLAWVLALRLRLTWLTLALSGGVLGLRCSFCNKSQRAVKKLISGPGIYICDECVEICQTILRENTDPEPSAPESQPTLV